MRHKLFAVLLAAVVALSMGADAWARAGKGSSLGSRGTRTYDRPIERTITPPSSTLSPTSPSAVQQPATQPMYNPGAMRSPSPMTPATAQPGFFQRNPMMGGLLGGLVGVGIGSMLFGHSPALAAASQAAPGASMIGMLLQLAVVGGLVWLAVRFFRRRAQPVAATPYRREMAGDYATAAAPSPRREEKEFEVTAEDQDAFGRIIAGVQKAWSDGNPVALRQFATPEVLGWMGEDLARDQSRGLRNVMEDVRLLKGDVSETWRDAELEYATAVITFSAKDYVVRIADNQVVEGDDSTPVEVSEAWTFVRSPGGTWLLSAIEQI